MNVVEWAFDWINIIALDRCLLWAITAGVQFARAANKRKPHWAASKGLARRKREKRHCAVIMLLAHTHTPIWNKKNHRKSYENGVSIFWCMYEINRVLSMLMYATYLLVCEMIRPLPRIFVSFIRCSVQQHIYFIAFRFAHILSGHSHCLLSLSPSNEMYVRVCVCKYIFELLFMLCVVLFLYVSQCYALPSTMSLFSF